MRESALLQRFNAPGPKRILSLDGGGVRGILSLGFLEKLEAQLRKRHDNPELLLCEYFDLIGGTSTGSIIATGLAMGMSASELKKYYFEMADNIFGKKKNIINYISKGERYDIKPLRTALKSVIGDTKLGDPERLKTGLCIVTKRADTFSTWPFINHPDGKFYKQNKDLDLWKIVRASSAAPTYFLPINLDLGDGEEGAFIDGGISMANNPSLTLLMIATLRGFPFHWPMGPDNLLMVSVGTGLLVQKYAQTDFKKMSLLGWAGMLPDYFMTDANYYNQLLMQILSDSPTAKNIDSEVGDLKYDSLNGRHALSYLRYDVNFDQESLNDLGFDYSVKKIREVSAMDNSRNIEVLASIGEKAAEKQVKGRHLPKVFDLNRPLDKGVRRFTQNKNQKLEFKKVVKKDTPIEAVQIDEVFEVETLEGLMRGKPGDYLMKGVEGELYVCDREIFLKTYKDV